MNVMVLDSSLGLDTAPEMVASECAGLTGADPLPLYEVVRRVRVQLIGRGLREHIEGKGVHLSNRAFGAVLNMVADLMVAQHEHDQPTIQGRTRR